MCRWADKEWVETGSAKTNGREPRRCLGQVFNSKLGRIATLDSKCMVCVQPLLKLKTQPRTRPVSMVEIKSFNFKQMLTLMLHEASS